MKFGSVPSLWYFFNNVAFNTGSLKMTELVQCGVCGSEAHPYCTITLAPSSWELGSLEECSEYFTLCTGNISQCQSGAPPLLVTGTKIHNTLLLLIDIIFVYCLSPKQPNHLISFDFTKSNSSSKYSHPWNMSRREAIPAHFTEREDSIIGMNY